MPFSLGVAEVDCASGSAWGEQSLSAWEALSGRARLPQGGGCAWLLCPRRAAEASEAPGTGPAALGACSRILHAQLPPLISLTVRIQKNEFRSSPVSSGATPSPCVPVSRVGTYTCCHSGALLVTASCWGAALPTPVWKQVQFALRRGDSDMWWRPFLTFLVACIPLAVPVGSGLGAS